MTIQSEPDAQGRTICEATVVINGAPCSFAEAMTLRVAVESLTEHMSKPLTLGRDAQGAAIRASYLCSLRTLREKIMLRGADGRSVADGMR